MKMVRRSIEMPTLLSIIGQRSVIDSFSVATSACTVPSHHPCRRAPQRPQSRGLRALLHTQVVSFTTHPSSAMHERKDFKATAVTLPNQIQLTMELQLYRSPVDRQAFTGYGPAIAMRLMRPPYKSIGEVSK